MRIAVLRGGPSAHFETSLQTGEFVLSHIRNEPLKYNPVDIFISKDGEWHLGGRKLAPHLALGNTDLVWNALHGGQGDGGQFSQLLNNLGLPHTGSSTLGLALSLNTDLAKQAYITHGMPTPRHQVLEGGVTLEDLLQIFQTYLHPVVVKPARGDDTKGVTKAHNFEELKDAVAGAFRHSDRVIVEEFVRGTEASCAVVEGLRGEKLYSLLPMPNTFKTEEHKMMEHLAKRAHEVLGLRHYSTSNFVVTPKGKIYIIGTNALPEITKNSLLAKSLPSVGLTPKEFIEHIVSIAK